MHAFPNYDFMVGIAVGKILLAAFLASSIFRNIALAAAGGTICLVYFQKGVTGLLQGAHLAIADFATRSDFSKGVALGAFLALIVFGAYLKRQRR